jgi:hypothetical protein
MELKLTMSDILEMAKKYILSKDTEMPVEDIIITDYEPKEVEEEDECLCEDADIPSLTKKSTIEKILKEALKDLGYERKIPRCACETCEEAMDEIYSDMSKKEKTIFRNFINTKNFAKFATLWQKLQTKINIQIR